ncbi:LysR family transcriptional regulator [Micromonospora echinaurantiaca]|uniref:LysR family transcriptional regulator n=1 Tax=Micromonospora echinaurantiaca TaxID=47857 RepID=UPI0037B120FA
MEFRHLQYFVAVAEELHFRRAAERLHIVQPALSQQIARLEEELGVRLLQRTKRHVELTAAGRVLLVEARAMLEHRDAATAAVRRAAAGSTGRLAVGFVGPAAYSVLPGVVRAFRGQYPDVDLSLHEHTTAEQLEMLAARQLDVGFLRLPSAAEGLELEQVLSEPICVVLPAGHPLDNRPKGAPLEVTELRGEGFVVVPRSREALVFDRIVALCHGAGFSPRVVQEAQQVHAIIGLVAAGMGIALVPDSMRALRRPGVVYRPLPPSSSTAVETGLAWRREEESPVVELFVRVVRTTAKNQVDGATSATP